MLRSTLPAAADAVLALCKLGRRGGQEANLPGYHGVRIGRNEVWRLTPDTGDTTLFVKFLTSSEHFHREVAGLQIANTLCGDNLSYNAPRLIFADDELLVIATTELQGRSLAQIIQNAFRMDRNPLHRRSPINHARDCVERAAECLATLHRHIAEPNLAIYDHSVEGVFDRLSRKLDNLMGCWPREEKAQLAELDRTREVCSAAVPALRGAPSTLIFGDPTPGNILLQKTSVGLIDFEDFGWGDPVRDWVIFHDSICSANVSWKYWWFDNLCESRFAPLIKDAKAAYFRVELILDRLRSCFSSWWRYSGRRRTAFRNLDFLLNSIRNA